MTELISKVNIFPVKANSGTLLANASFTVADAFVVKCKVIKTQKGLMISMPSEKGTDKDGNTKYYDHVFPISSDARTEMTRKVLDAYNEKVGNVSSDNKPATGSTRKDKVPF
jgi:DNA-binding cell septation regulator SpoVG